ncbi:MAG TPA: ATP-binding protein [Polyangiaceae bacterium]|jgi:anti-sigma regulatory factor (Ser/Thr protein kinase)|nr:ATP-binding protein [Polyangiaceae bacterium]
MSRHTVREALDIYALREAVNQLALELGFSRRERAELLIVASELCTNIVKYGVRGSLELQRHVDVVQGVGIVLIAHDVGPAFRDLKMALQDGCDDQGPIDPGVLMKRGGLGIGLGAVKRLTDLLTVEYSSEGKAVRVVRYLKRPARKSSLPPGR